MSRNGENTANNGKLTLSFFIVLVIFNWRHRLSDHDIGAMKCFYYIGVAIGANHFWLPDFLQCRFPVSPFKLKWYVFESTSHFGTIITIFILPISNQSQSSKVFCYTIFVMV